MNLYVGRIAASGLLLGLYKLAGHRNVNGSDEIGGEDETIG